MASTPVQVLHGLYLGLLAGVVPALVAFGLGFLFRYVVGVSIPAFGVVVLGVALAGVSGGLLAFADPTITQAANSVTLLLALLVVSMLTLYMHAIGDRLGADLPRRITLRGLRERTLNADVVSFVGGRREVTVRVVGAVRDVEGYPPLSEPLRAEIRNVEWQFPADLPLSELESRVADRLRSEFDVQEASVTLDERGRASVAAAPPAAGVSSRTPPGKRAVSVWTLVPTGVARGDEVSVLVDDDREADSVDGTVVSARTGQSGSQSAASSATDRTNEDDRGSSGEAAGRSTAAANRRSSDGADRRSGGDANRRSPGGADRGSRDESSRTLTDDGAASAPTPAPTTTGGEGRLTLAVSRSDAERLLASGDAPVVVNARGTHREYELLGVLRRAGQRVRRLAVAGDSQLLADDEPVTPDAVREHHDVAVLAVRDGGSWQVSPDADAALAADVELFVAGSRDALDRFAEVVA